MKRMLVLLALCLTTSAALATPRYAIMDLGQLPVPLGASAVTENPTGHAQVIANAYDLTTKAAALNNQGQVVGQSNGQAFLWQNGVMRGLGVLPSTGWGDYNRSRADAINSTGEVVGGSGGFGPLVMSGLYDCYAFRYASGQMESLSSAMEVRSYEAFGINDRGDIVGLHEYHAFYRHNGRLVDLGTLSHVPAGNRSHADGLNERGQVVGVSSVGNSGALYSHATLWRQRGNNWRATDLKTLPGYVNSEAHAINNPGQIVGEATLDEPGKPGQIWGHAFLWSQGRMSALPGAGESTALAINDKGQIVGAADGRAALWQDGRVYDLNALTAPASGWILTAATGINSRGQIVANGTLHGQARAFLLTPQKNNL